MATKTIKLLRTFHFDSRRTFGLTFSDKIKIRLNDDVKSDPYVSLKSVGAGLFSTDLDITATTETINPGRLVKWLGFEGIQEEPSNTSIRYRILINGAQENFWDGSSWATPSSDADWNTFEDINLNISTLPLQSRDIAIRANIRSTDGSNTAELRAIKLLGEFRINWLNDLTLDTVLPKLRSDFRSTTIIGVQLSQSRSDIDFSGDHKLDNVGYNFLNVISVFNDSNDPNRMIDIAQSYAPGPLGPDGQSEPGQITLVGPQNSGDLLLIEMEIVPEIARTTDVDYVEQSRLPVLIIENVVELKPRDGSRQELNQGHPGEFIRNTTDATAVQTTPPKQLVLRYDFRMMANNEDDLFNMIDAMSIWLTQNRILSTYGLDVKVVIDPVQDVNVLKKVDLDDVKEAIGSFQIQGVPFFLEDSKDHHLIENLDVNILNT